MLERVRILDLTHFLAGPYCTLILADLGADVIRIEDPEHPDEARSMPPHKLGGESLYFLSLNWGKRSLGLRIGSTAGREVFLSLVSKADVVVANYRVGVLEKLGLDHKALAARNDRIITCSITGFGEDGPYARRAGYDYTVTALAGIQDLTADPPTRPGVSYADHSGGMAAAVAVLAALLEREATGRGRHLDVGLLDVQASFLSYLASFALNAGDVARSLPNGSHPVLVPAQNFATADGHVSLFVGNDAMWSRAKEVLRVAELEDPRFNSVAGRLSHRNEVVSLVTPVLLGATTEHWVRTFEAVLVPCAPVNRLDQALEDPQIRARGMIETDEHSVYGTYRHVVGPLPTLRRQTRPAPRLGEHSADVLAESGMDRAQVERLIAAGTVSIPSRASGA